MLTDLALSALTDVILACLIFFLAGKTLGPEVERGSPAWFWSGAFLLVGTATALGAIDHGFFEPVDHPAHPIMTAATRVTIVLASFAMLTATARQFLSPMVGRAVLAVGAAIGAATIVAILTGDNFLAVVACYSAALIILLLLSARSIRRERGWAFMVGGIAIAMVASALPFTGSDGMFGLGLYGTYHVILMPAMVGFYLGGRRFRRHAATA